MLFSAIVVQTEVRYSAHVFPSVNHQKAAARLVNAIFQGGLGGWIIVVIYLD